MLDEPTNHLDLRVDQRARPKGSRSYEGTAIRRDPRPGAHLRGGDAHLGPARGRASRRLHRARSTSSWRSTRTRGAPPVERRQSDMRRQVKAPEVKRELAPGQSTALLKELHLLTRAAISTRTPAQAQAGEPPRRLLAPALDDVLARFGDPVVVDCRRRQGLPRLHPPRAVPRAAGRGARLGRVAARADRAARRRARRGSASTRMRFETAAIEEASCPSASTSSPRCTPATPPPTTRSSSPSRGADHVAVVPCCQAEVARQLEEQRRRPPPPLRALFAHPWHRREFGSHLTNVDPRAGARGARLPGHGDRAGRLGALAEERADPGAEGAQ